MGTQQTDIQWRNYFMENMKEENKKQKSESELNESISTFFV